MNDDRCTHIPVSPGQTMCTCTSRRVFLENLVSLQSQRILELEAQIQGKRPSVIYVTKGANSV